jgi:hypothetical protein
MPDAETLVYQTLKHLGGITAWAFDAQCEWPFVEDRVGIQVDVRASSKKRARDRAYEARQLLLRLPLDVTNSVTRVEVVGGPFFLADEDGAPRYVIRTVVAVRAMRGIG